MSATNRGAARVENDFYGTPEWCTNAIIKRLDLHRDTQILEPGCGTGAIVRRLEKQGYSCVTDIELDPVRGEQCNALIGDFLAGEPTEHCMDVAIGNPPYSLAMEFVQMSMRYAPCVVMLLRLNWLSSKGRADFHRKHPAHVHVLEQRPSFCVSITCKLCKWHVSLDPAAARHKACPVCHSESKLSVVTTDATEYAWFQWGGPGYVPGKWEILAT